MSRLLLVEDDEGIGRRVEAALRANGHVVAWQRTGASALIEAERTMFDLVVLDLGLPDTDGVEVCRDLRVRQPGCVILMLTARRDEMDVVVGLEAGADDYVTKPFGLNELLARIRAHLRRQATDDAVAPESFVDGDLVLDLHARRCSVAGVTVELRAKEFDLLARLAREPGRAVSRDQLMADVWDENWFGSTKTLDVHIAAVRRRLAAPADLIDRPLRVPTISTLRGHGYRLDRC
ncbi:MAG TPA: response regulator transcription factor [Sporichthya sp.]|nr:response regulator transcription factor [Sporichthya sp.]